MEKQLKLKPKSFTKKDIAKKLNVVELRQNVSRVNRTFNYNIKNTFETSLVSKHYNNSSLMNIRIFDYFKEMELEFEIFRKAYVNQRKQFKLLKAYQDLLNESINDEMYDIIEEKCTIEISKYEDNLSHKIVYKFLKNHKDFQETYSSSELSELLGIDYKQVKKILKTRKEEVK